MPALAVSSILSERLTLVPMSPAFLEASLGGDAAAAAALIGLSVPQAWLDERLLMQLRLDQLRHDPALQPWLLRAVGERSSGTMVGHIGFHTAPNPAYLQPLAPGGIELGYTIFAPFRRQGYAREACAALMDWAAQAQQLTRFVLSISPDNTPSQRIAQHFGFRKVGAHIDDEDGPEDVFVLDRV